ncbi:MAG: transporter substrate-binding domain-containing protein [Pseudomonadota bacterium]
MGSRRWLIALICMLFSDIAVAQQLNVVTVTRTPFSFVEEGADTGFAIDLIQRIGAELDREISITRVETFQDMLAAVENGDADLAAANISITADREAQLDFSQPIFSAGLRVMVPIEDGGGGSLLTVIWNRDFLLVLLGAFALLFGGGMLMWRFERGGGQPYFQGSAREKAFPAFWWALNLVVNGGFEERIPHSPLGRLFGTALVLSSLFVVSIFVANITAAMTVQAIQASVQSVNDLYGRRVGTTSGSTASVFLDGRDIRYSGFDGLDELLEAFEDGRVNAVVFDAPILSYYVNTSGNAFGELVGPVFLRENYGFALPTDSVLREPINRVLLRFREDGTYEALRRDWFGTDEGG